MSIQLSTLRRFAVARTLQTQASLMAAIEAMGYVQADPMRAPARAQDLILRLRVPGYQAGDLDAAYASLPLEEDFIINYGFLPRAAALLLHPRQAARPWSPARWRQAHEVLARIRTLGSAKPGDLVDQFGAHTTKNAWGGDSSAISQLLDGMQYRSLLRVARRDGGHRVYAPLEMPAEPVSASVAAAELLALLVRLYAPVTERGLRLLASMLARGSPQLGEAVRTACTVARRELPQTQLDGQTWLWPEGESPAQAQWPHSRGARLLAPFDPLVWDRQRFELLWGWAYRFEAYTPAAKRRLGHYAMPILVGTEVLGWCNAKQVGERLHAEIGFVRPMAQYPHLRNDVEADLQQFAHFLGLGARDAVVTRHDHSVW